MKIRFNLHVTIQLRHDFLHLQEGRPTMARAPRTTVRDGEINFTRGAPHKSAFDAFKGRAVRGGRRRKCCGRIRNFVRMGVTLNSDMNFSFLVF